MMELRRGLRVGMRRLRHLAAAVAAVVGVVSCTTAPAPDAATPGGYEFLPADADMYFAFDGQVVRDVLSGESPLSAGLEVLDLEAMGSAGGPSMPSSDDLDQLTDRLFRVYGAISSDSGRLFLAVEGDFPSSLLDFGLSTAQDFRRRTLFVDGVRGDYFYSEALAVELHLPSNGIVLASTGGIESLMAGARRPRVPRPLAGLEEEFAALPVALLINAPDDADVVELLGLPVRLSIQDVFVGTEARGDADVMLSGRIRFADEQTAAAFSRVIRFALLAIFADSDIPRAELMAGFSAESEGSVVTFSGLPIPWRFIEALAPEPGEGGGPNGQPDGESDGGPGDGAAQAGEERDDGGSE